MNIEDLLEQLICDRMDMVQKKQSQEFAREAEHLYKQHEELVKRLDQEAGQELEQFLDEWIAHEAEENRHLYLSGIGDGIQIAKTVLKI